jgi:transcriptional regulator with GAF, ATPase, and Fis domain
MKSTERLSMIKELVVALLDEVEHLAKAQDSESKLHDEGTGFYEMVEAYEIFLIRRALLKTDWHQRRAAELLQLKPTTLNNLIKVYGINKHKKAPDNFVNEQDSDTTRINSVKCNQFSSPAN